MGAAPPKELPRVTVATPIVRDVNDYQYFIGRSQAVQSVDLQAKVTGYLENIYYLHGTELKQDVKKDQPLFKIDPQPYQATLDQALGQLDLAKARLKLAIADYARALEVAKTPGAISQQDVDKYAASEAEARAEVTAQQANVRAAQLNVGYTNIAAPFDGRVSRNMVDAKDLVKQNETLLATVVTETPIYVYVEIDDQTMLRVKRLMQEGKIKTKDEGGQFPIDIGLSDEGSDYPHRGVLDYVDNQLNPTTGTLQIRAVLDNPAIAAGGPRLLEPAQFVRVRFSLGPKFRALIVRQDALGTDQDKKYLLVLAERNGVKNVVEYRPVRVGPEQPGGLQVVFPLPMVMTKKGLQPAPMQGEQEKHWMPSVQAGDLVIVDGLQFAPRGKPVSPTVVSMVDADAEPVKSQTQTGSQPTGGSTPGADANDQADPPLPPPPTAQSTADKTP
jgi:RND family efflux transporter MFP subunit